MLDPLSALILASSIAQLVEVIRDAISDGRQIAELGSTSEHEHIGIIVKDISTLSAKIINRPVPNTDSSDDDIALHELGQATCEVSTELASLLEGLQIQKPQHTGKRKRDVLSISLKAMMKKDEILKLQKRLESLQQELSLRLTFMMSISVEKGTLGWENSILA